MKATSFFVSCLGLFLLTACKVEKSTKASKHGDELRNLNSVAIETGTTYVSECAMDSSGGHYTASFRTYEINGIKRASTSVIYYSDANCQKRLFNKFSLANSELAENDKLLILQYTRATLTVKDGAAAALFSQKGLCGIYNWEVNKTRDITNSRECEMPAEEYFYLNADKRDFSIRVYMCPVRKFSTSCPSIRFTPEQEKQAALLPHTNLEV